MLLSCTISIFLCTTLCAEAQEIDSRELEAVCCERTVWEGASADEVNDALLCRSELLAQTGRYADAMASLQRVRRFLLTDEQNADLSRMMFVCSYASGDLEQAAALALEMGLLEEAEPRRISTRTAELLSLLPPLGHIYVHDYAGGALSLGLNAASVSWAVVQGVSGAWIASLLGGAMALNYTYNGSREAVSAAAQSQKERLKYLEAPLKSIYEQIISAR